MSNFDPFDDETAVAPPELQDEMKKRGRAHLVRRETHDPHAEQESNRAPSIANEPPIAPHRNLAPLRLDEENFDPPSTKRMVPLGKGGELADSPDEFTVEEKRPLANSDLQRIADRIRLASAPASDPDRGFLTVTVGSDKGRRIGLPEGRTTIGRSTDNDIVLTDISVSRRHITVERRDKIYYICDIGSGNGTIVNGRRREGEILIVNGDSFCIGNTEIGFEGPEAQQHDALPTNTWDKPNGKGSPPPIDLQDSEDEPTVMGKGPTKERDSMADVAFEEPTNVVPSVEVSPEAHLSESKIQRNIAPIHLDEGPSDDDAQAAAIDAIESIISTPEPEILSMHTILPDADVDNQRAQSEPQVFSSAPSAPVPVLNLVKKKPAPTIMGSGMPALPQPSPSPPPPSFRDAPAPLVTNAPVPSPPSNVELGQWPTPGQNTNPPGQNPHNPAMSGAPMQSGVGMSAMQNSAAGAPQGMAPQPYQGSGAPMPMQNSGPMPMAGMQNSGPMASQPMQNSGPMPMAGMQNSGPVGMHNSGAIPSYESLSNPMLAGGHTDHLRGRYAAKPKNKSSKGLIALICLALVLVAGGIVAAVNGQATDSEEVSAVGDDKINADAAEEAVTDEDNKDPATEPAADPDTKLAADPDTKPANDPDTVAVATDPDTKPVDDPKAKTASAPETKPTSDPKTVAVANPARDPDTKEPTGSGDDGKPGEENQDVNIGSLIAQNTALPASTWGNDESFLSDIPVPIPPDIKPPEVPKVAKVPKVTKVTKRPIKTTVRKPKRNDPPKVNKGKTSAIKAAARGLYKRERYADAADKLENAADDFDGDEADELFALADKYRQIGKLLNNVKSSNPTSGLSALKKALAKDRSVGGSLSKLIRLRIGEIAPKAASAYMAKKNYSKAKSAADDAKRENAGAAVARIFTSLERKAATNIKKAKRAQKSGDRDEAKGLLQEAIKMAPKGSEPGNEARDLLRKL